MNEKKLYVVLSDIRSAYNVGAAFRTADGAGVSEVLLVGYTPAPVDRFGRARADIHKAALGAESVVPWRHFQTLEECLSELKKRDIDIIVVEQLPEAVPYDTYECVRDTALVFGNEREGVPRAVLPEADAALYIPMHGAKESLNVSVAIGIVLFSLRR